MESAFGIDHGYEDVEKAFGMGALAGGLRKLGQGIGMSARTGAKNVGQAAGKNVNAGGMRGRLGQGQIRTGQALKRTSNFAMRRPGLAGGAAVGGAGAATFGAGSAFGNRRRY